jgi:hypothetical protein
LAKAGALGRSTNDGRTQKFFLQVPRIWPLFEPRNAPFFA